ncbi:MAG: hypothetical protein K9K86_09215 [Pseudomonadales bacterium]|nr:hypothetical protein [Pseudomonadales bacterium]
MSCRRSSHYAKVSIKYFLPPLWLIIGLIQASPVVADGAVIDKIYHPYVDALEQEVEYRMLFQDDQPGLSDDLQLHRLSYGHSIGARWFGEIYLVGVKSDDESFEVTAYELEAKWQLTEQGEFWADWGLLFEIEEETDLDIWEFSTGLLVEKEWGQWSSTANFIVTQEWGKDIEDELETALGVQLRYRYSRQLEPAVEIYKGEDTFALGPVLMGDINTGIRRNLHWETGFIFALDDKSPNQTVRLLLEYEF